MNETTQFNENISTSDITDSSNYTTPISSYTTTETFNETPPRNNIFLGIIGAVIFGAIGSILWIVLYQIGIIASIAGFVIVSLAIWGYTKLGGSINGLGIVLCILISFVIIYLANRLCLTWDFYDLLKEAYPESEISFLGIFSDGELLFKTDSDVTFHFVLDLIVGYVFTIGAIVKIVKQKFR